MSASNVILGTLLGAGGVGAALYLTGIISKDKLLALADREPPMPALPPPTPEVITAPAPAPAPTPPPAPVPSPVAAPAAAPATPALTIEQIKAEAAAAAEARVKAEFESRDAAARTEAERKRLTGEGWTRPTANEGRGATPSTTPRLEIPEGWDEEKYMTKYPDVRKAVNDGAFPSGLAHYLKYGKSEGRTMGRWFGGWGSLLRRPRRSQRPGNLSGIRANWDWR